MTPPRQPWPPTMLPFVESTSMHPGHQMAMQLRKAYLAFHRRADAATTAAGITADQFVLLTLLAEADGVVQKELVARAASDPNTIAAMLRRLETRQLIRRQADAADGRLRRVFLTAVGRRLQAQVARATEPLLAALWTALPPSQRQSTLAALEEIARRFTEGDAASA